MIPGNGPAIVLLLAVMTHGVIRRAGMYKTLLIWLYAVARVVAGVLWVFRFSSPMGVLSFALQSVGIQWNHRLNSNHAMTLIEAVSPALGQTIGLLPPSDRVQHFDATTGRRIDH